MVRSVRPLHLGREDSETRAQRSTGCVGFVTSSLVFDLELHGPDTYVGTGPRYPWSGLYGGQIVAQGLRAAAATVDDDLAAHSLRAYFIRRGADDEPVRYEVDRIRNGRSFATRRVVARQAVGAILNLEASFQRPEPAPVIVTIPGTGLRVEDANPDDSWMPTFERRFVPESALDEQVREGAGRVAAWMRVVEDLGEPTTPATGLLHQCWLAYLSDDLAFDSARRLHPRRDEPDFEDEQMGASLDHTIWFHRPLRADRWHLHDVSCLGYFGHRGLALGRVFDEGGDHVATFAQEYLLRVKGDA